MWAVEESHCWLGCWGRDVISGALCYAELATALSARWWQYHYLQRAFGKTSPFLFAWARMTVIQTGSIALLAFVFGDYASQLFRLGDYSPSFTQLLLLRS